MADEFGAQDLEDGELWLPSDFFSMDEHEPQLPTQITSPSPCMEPFRRLSSSAFLHRVPPLLQRFKPAVWYGLGGDCGGVCAGFSPLYRANPVQGQIETFLGERARPVQNPVDLNRVYPPSGRGGTGVFLPRTSNYLQGSNYHSPHTLGRAPGTYNDSPEFYKLPPRKKYSRRKERSGYGGIAAEVGMANIWNY